MCPQSSQPASIQAKNTIHHPFQQIAMGGLVEKVVASVALWGDADRRRREVLAACLMWAIGMTMIGTVFTILAATGTFPAPLPVLQASGLLGVYLAKYILYGLSGACAYFAVKSARSCLRAGKGTGAAKALLVVSALAVLASSCLTIASLVRSAQFSSHHTTPAWVYVIQVLILCLRILFFSVLALAIYTLVETDKQPQLAEIVGGVSPDKLPTTTTAGTHMAPPGVMQPQYQAPDPFAHTKTMHMQQPDAAAAPPGHPWTVPASTQPPQPPDAAVGHKGDTGATTTGPSAAMSAPGTAPAPAAVAPSNNQPFAPASSGPSAFPAGTYPPQPQAAPGAFYPASFTPQHAVQQQLQQQPGVFYPASFPQQQQQAAFVAPGMHVGVAAAPAAPMFVQMPPPAPAAVPQRNNRPGAASVLGAYMVGRHVGRRVERSRRRW